MFTSRHQDTLFDFLIRPEFRIWRHALFLVALVPITLSQSFFVLGRHGEIPTSIIYYFGTCLAFTIIALAYFNSYYLAPHFLRKEEYASYFLALLIAVSVFFLVKHMGEYLIFSNAGIKREFSGVTVLDGFSNLMLYTVCIASSSITILFRQWMAENAEIESLENKQLKNSIDDIKSSIQPQFLYATLDYAAEKVKSDPEQTSDTLFKLSELLRYQLYDCKRNKVLLESDIGFIRNYLILERQNSENRLSFTISVNVDGNKFIPPGLFIPWIEELIKQDPATLDVKFEIDDCLIKFECAVSGMDLSRCDFPKIGQKLKSLYDNEIVISKGMDSIALQLTLC